jgi:hypothetical protein
VPNRKRLTGGKKKMGVWKNMVAFGENIHEMGSPNRIVIKKQEPVVPTPVL